MFVYSHFGKVAVTKQSEGVGCTLSSDKNGYSLQRLVAEVGKVVAIG